MHEETQQVLYVHVYTSMYAPFHTTCKGAGTKGSAYYIAVTMDHHLDIF